MAKRTKQEIDKEENIIEEEVIEKPNFIGSSNDESCEDDCTYKGLEDVADAIDNLSGAIVPLKLYHSLGNNDDGAISQDVVTDELNSKFDKQYVEGGEKGQFLIRNNSEVDFTFDYITAIPDKGNTGQVLAKKSNSDYDTEWVDAGGGGGTQHGIPAGGTTGQALVKSSDLDYEAEWNDIEGILPSGGTTGQVLKKQSNTNYDAEWEDEASGLPAGGLTGQFLRKKSTADGDAEWATVEGGASIMLIEYPSVSEWVEDTTLEGYSYKGTIEVTGIDDSWGVIINLNEDAEEEKIAKSTNTGTDAVYIYATEELEEVLINSIYLLKE